MTDQNTLTTENEVERIVKEANDRLMKFEHEPSIWNGMMVYEAGDIEGFLVWLSSILTPPIADRNARAREVVRELVDLFDESGNKVARNCVLFTARIHGIDLSEPKN